MSNAIIRASFETRLKTWADAQTNPKVYISFQGVPFTKPVDGSTFIECILVPNVTLNPTLDGARKTYYGIFQVNCWAPQGKGMRAVETLSQAIVDLFPLVPKTGGVSIEGTPSTRPALQDASGWVVVPVTIKYRYEAN
jgi:hypothetical protein